MIDHLSLGVRNLSRSIAFYDVVLAPLGIVRVWGDDEAAGYGYPGGSDGLALKRSPNGAIAIDPRSHVAFVARDRASVVAFHSAALACGAIGDGAPGI